MYHVGSLPEAKAPSHSRPEESIHRIEVQWLEVLLVCRLDDILVLQQHCFTRPVLQHSFARSHAERGIPEGYLGTIWEGGTFSKGASRRGRAKIESHDRNRCCHMSRYRYIGLRHRPRPQRRTAILMVPDVWGVFLE